MTPNPNPNPSPAKPAKPANRSPVSEATAQKLGGNTTATELGVVVQASKARDGIGEFG